MSGKALIILVLGISGIVTMLALNFTDTSTDANDNMVVHFSDQTAQNISQSGINMALRELASDTSWRAGYSDLSVFYGTLDVSLKDTVFTGLNVVKITSIGSSDDQTARSIVYTQLIISQGYIPASVLAAITTNNPVLTNGTLVVDGRDHDLNGNLVPFAGTYAIWTTNDLERKGNSKLGSTESGSDYIPAKSENDDLRLETQSYPGGYPTTPDAIMGGAAKGFSEGTLKSIAQSGGGGSQYVTDPSLLSYPLNGVTYVELPSGSEWKPVDIQGDGILIVHNSSLDAVMKNVNSGTFKGLIIADDIVHIHATIIGALVGLSPTPSSGNTVGNGNGDVLYSRQAIMQATSTAGNSSGGGSAANVVAWWN